jgi:hypothetical protein
VRRAGYIVELKSNPDLQSKKAGPNALPFLSSLSAKSHLDEMNSHATVGAAMGLMSATTAMHSGDSLSRKARLLPETINIIISIDNLTPVSYPRDDNKQ